MGKKDNKLSTILKTHITHYRTKEKMEQLLLKSRKRFRDLYPYHLTQMEIFHRFYADGIQYYVSAANNGYEGDAEFALIPDSFRQDVLKEKKDEKGVLHEISDSTDTQKFAFLLEFDGDQKGIRRVLYNCTATRPSIESETKEDSIEPGTETITISNAPLPNGRVKAQTTVDTDDTVYSGWYKTVYYPETITEATQAVNVDKKAAGE